MNILLGVSGSVAAYRAADLARELMRHGHSLRVCLTDAAEKFVTRSLFEALTGEPCLQDTFEEPVAGRMAHIDWARWADLVLVAPATANTLVKLAHGVGEDMLTTLALATHAPLVVAPAMNPSMYTHEATQEALGVLQGRAASVVEPAEGDVACGEKGQGKLASVERIVGVVQEIAARSQKLAGKTVLITSGPTYEPVDDVRFIGNRSSGKMGTALARASLLMGAARVVVVSGPVSVVYPVGAEVVRVRTAQEMLFAAVPYAPSADLIIGAAAVGDYRVETPFEGKHRRSGSDLHLKLVPNPDVLLGLSQAASAEAVVVGFAAEPSADLAISRTKLERKGLAAIAANDVSRPEIGFDSESNALTLLTQDGRQIDSGVRSKLSCALWLLDQVV